MSEEACDERPKRLNNKNGRTREDIRGRETSGSSVLLVYRSQIHFEVREGEITIGN